MAKPVSKGPSKGKTGANAVLFVLLVLGAFGAANVISMRSFARIDMTQDKVYTLSQGSKDLVKNLPDRMNVKLFMSEDLKPPFKDHSQFVRDLLAEYAAYSGGKFNVEVIKIAEGDTKKEEEAGKYHVQKSQRATMSANKFEMGATYLGIGFDYHGDIQSIPVVGRTEGLEFHISGLIKQMTVKKKKVAFATSEGEPQTTNHGGIEILEQSLKQSGFDTVSLELKATIPADVDALLVVGPKQAFSERAKYVIDQFLMRGKAVGFFVAGQTMQTPRGMMMPGMDMPQIAQNNDTQLDDLLGAYGIKIKPDIILDRQNYIGPVTVGQQVHGINHPVFVASAPLPQDHPVNQNFRAVVLPYTSSVELVGDAKEGKGPAKFTLLMQSSVQSWRPQGPFVFSAAQNPRDMTMSSDRGPFPIGYAASGKFKSAFAGKQIVKEDGTKVDANVTVPGVEPLVAEAKDVARLVVIGDADFLSDQYVGIGLQNGLKPYEDNLYYALNLIDWLAQDEALSQVRSKGMKGRPLDEVSDRTVTLVKAANIVGLPLLLLLIGLIRWRLRSVSRSSVTL